MAEMMDMIHAALCFGVVGTLLSALALALYWRDR